MSVSASLRGLGRAVEHDLAAALARARAHVDQAVGGQHHGRVVLDHHQRVAGIAQALHRLDDAVHVARMQADRLGSSSTNSVLTSEVPSAVVRLMRCTSPPRQRAALAIEREVADADVVQVAQARADLVEQQLQRRRRAGRCRRLSMRSKKRADARSAAASGRAGRGPAAPRAARATTSTPTGMKRFAGGSTASASLLACRCATAAPRASAARRRRPGTACSCGTSTSSTRMCIL